ncbi:MAG: hypothetical protein KatS3mg118_3010 [Paracoccaceae bacterium]|nr:MAG: hypothetical protein KatS3mg118_3010 [Paracoccaceae bacterium]
MVKTRKLDLIEGDGQPQHAWVRKDKGRRRYVIDLAALRQSEDHAPDR